MREIEELYPLFKKFDYDLYSIIKYSRENFELEESLIYLDFIKNDYIFRENTAVTTWGVVRTPNFIETIESEINSLNQLIIFSEKQKTSSIMTSKLQKVQWNKDDTHLYYLMDLLVKYGYFREADKSNFTEIVKELFIDRKGKPFKNKDIDQALDNIKNNKTGKPRNAESVENILSKLNNK